MPARVSGRQVPHDGGGYAGAILYIHPGANPEWLEYIEVPLSTPLTAAETYLLTFYVSLTEDSRYGIADIGAHFSIGAVTAPGSVALNVTPQIVNTNGPLVSKTNWRARIPDGLWLPATSQAKPPDPNRSLESGGDVRQGRSAGW